NPRQFIAMLVRSGAKPECISGLIERALARCALSAGQSCRSGWHSARYSEIASESQTVTAPASSTGTLPDGPYLRSASLEPARYRGTRTSSNTSPDCFINSHGRRDQDEI